MTYKLLFCVKLGGREIVKVDEGKNPKYDIVKVNVGIAALTIGLELDLRWGIGEEN